MANPRAPLINIDSAFDPLDPSEVTAEIIEARISMLAFRNFDSIPKRLPFVLDLCTREPRFWRQISSSCSEAIWLEEENEWVLVLHATQDCGYIRTCRFQPCVAAEVPSQYCRNIRAVQSADVLYSLLDTQAAQHVFDAWNKAKSAAIELPTEFVTGRLTNTSVERAMVFSRGEGCVLCGGVASCYAATTVGDSAHALMLHLPVCREHLAEARSHPSVFSFLASLFHLSVDTEGLEKWDHIPDQLIPAIHIAVAEELEGEVGRAEKRERGWHLWIVLDTGWKWLLRVGSFTDYAYMLYEPGVKRERYRADSAPDHPEVKFFPFHQHSAPGKKRDRVSPSFLYGLPLFDVKQFQVVGRELGAYPEDND